jgi:tetratricopeptide (TPR) repeat protein
MLEAVEYLKYATDKIDYNDRVAYNYGLVLQQLGKRTEAEAAFKKGLTINPDSESNLYALGYLYYEQNRMKEARQILTQLVTLAPTNQQYRQLLNAVSQ